MQMKQIHTMGLSLGVRAIRKKIVFLTIKRSVKGRNSYFAGKDRKISAVREGLWEVC